MFLHLPSFLIHRFAVPLPPGEGICSVPQAFKHQFVVLLS